ncbi:uracil-DNA glycosylase [Candidatus Woesearchaeota archaeon]|nr:uracil-DNA glycosylase [Nanoarchaeota archaeon]MCB9370579.1 uracil-DNA glycosylase [Candidatus Woesearchaeota archaeon]USN43661.1 MAG: uracil-DNA glycosylase [Candidatus Woesearchaeota archaeon]
MEKALELEAIKEKILSEMVCPLKDAATNLVFGKGNPNAQIMFIGEAPGENEDLQGLPFVGRAGKELDKLLNTIGLGIDDVYIANILKYRPPKNRDPAKDEIERHTPYLIEQIKVIRPKVIATLGNYSTKFVLGGFKVETMSKVSGISLLHGKPKKMNFPSWNFVVVPIYHPAAMLYRPALRAELEADFQVMKKVISSDGHQDSVQKTLEFS